MTKSFKNIAKISVQNARETENGVVSFAEPLAITDDSRQWNNTRYNIESLDISTYDGTVTADHGQKISDVIGKIINLRKDGNKVVIDGIKFAVNENPLAVLAKNLMKAGFVTGVSIETIGEDPDETLTWNNHALCGLSVVAHPNNKNAYAVVANSITEAQALGFKEEEMQELNQLSAQERVANLHEMTDAILNKLTLNGGAGSGWWNPDHAARMAINGGNGKAVKGSLSIDDDEYDIKVDGKSAAIGAYKLLSLRRAGKKIGVNGSSGGNDTADEITKKVDEDIQNNKGLQVEFTNVKGGQKQAIQDALRSIDSTFLAISDLAGYSRSSANYGDTRERGQDLYGDEFMPMKADIARVKNALRNVNIKDSDGKEVQFTKVLDSIVDNFDDYLSGF